MLWNGLDRFWNGLELELDDIMIIIVILFYDMNCMFDDNMVNDTKIQLNYCYFLDFHWNQYKIHKTIVNISNYLEFLQGKIIVPFNFDETLQLN